MMVLPNEAAPWHSGKISIRGNYAVKARVPYRLGQTTVMAGFERIVCYN
jgi:hypothetical protein